MKVLRVYLKHHNGVYIDCKVADNADMGMLVTAIKLEGHVLRNDQETVPVYIPLSEVSLIVLLTLQEAGEVPQGFTELFPRKPN